MTAKKITIKHIRQQLEDLHQQKYNSCFNKTKKKNMYKGLGLNWRSAVVIVLLSPLIYLGGFN